MSDISPELLIESPIRSHAELAEVIEHVRDVIKPGVLVLVEKQNSYNFSRTTDVTAFMSDGNISDSGEFGVHKGMTHSYAAQGGSRHHVHPLFEENMIRIGKSYSSTREWSYDCGLSSGHGSDLLTSRVNQIVVGTDYIEAEKPGVSEALEFANDSILMHDVKGYYNSKPQINTNEKVNVLNSAGEPIGEQVINTISAVVFILNAFRGAKSLMYNSSNLSVVHKPMSEESPHTDIDVHIGNDVLAGTLRLSNMWEMFRPSADYVDLARLALLGEFPKAREYKPDRWYNIIHRTSDGLFLGLILLAKLN